MDVLLFVLPLVNGVVNCERSEIASGVYSKINGGEARLSSWLNACKPKSFAIAYWIRNNRETNPSRMMEGGAHMRGCDYYRIIA